MGLLATACRGSRSSKEARLVVYESRVHKGEDILILTLPRPSRRTLSDLISR